MEATKKRNIKKGEQYDHYFARATGKDITIKKSASLDDTVTFIPKVVRQTLGHTSPIAHSVLKGKTVYETCKNTWHFVFDHIQYRKDKTGYEQIRSPRRTWHDRTYGVDCDCYSVFISSILTNLGIPHFLRITKYNRNHFQHIYPIVPFGNKYITIDCVTDRFDFEVPYSEKKDFKMELQFLDGLPNDGMDELGKLFKRNMAKKKGAVATPAKKPGLLQQIKAKASAKKANATAPGAALPAAPKKKKKGILKKIVSVVNKVNPATILLRNGLLAAMKLNVKNVAKRLRWSYLTPEQAAAKGIEAEKYQRLVATRQKLENLFETGGGKISNLKNAILKGKGNKDKAISGLGMIPSAGVDYLTVHTPLEQLLGNEIYYSENVEGFNGLNALDSLGELGEPVTLASVGAAMGIISGIIASLKQIGNIFKGKEPGSEDFDEATNEAAENNQPIPDTTTVPSTATNPLLPEQQMPADKENPITTQYSNATDNSFVANSTAATATEDVEMEEDQENEYALTTTNSKSNLPATNDNDGKQGFWDKNKSWIKPVAIVGGSIALIAISAKVLKAEKAKNKSSPRSLSGFPKTRRKKHNRKKSKHSKKAAVALL